MKLFNKGDEEASFYRILLSDSEYLPLPSAFANKYLDSRKKQNIVLQLTSKSCVEWRVKYVRIEDRYYFMGGWLRFMKENRLQFGDFLVFWLRSRYPNPIFQVFIYSPNGSLKPTGSNKPRSVVESMARSFTRVIRKSNICRMLLPNSFVKATGISVYSMLRLKNKRGKMWEVKLSKYLGGSGRVGVPFMTGGLVKFMTDNKVKIGDTCKFDHVKANLLHFRVLKKKKDHL